MSRNFIIRWFLLHLYYIFIWNIQLDLGIKLLSSFLSIEVIQPKFQEFTVFSLRKSPFHVVSQLEINNIYCFLWYFSRWESFLNYNFWQFFWEFYKSHKINVYMRILCEKLPNFVLFLTSSLNFLFLMWTGIIEFKIYYKHCNSRHC